MICCLYISNIWWKFTSVNWGPSIAICSSLPRLMSLILDPRQFLIKWVWFQQKWLWSNKRVPPPPQKIYPVWNPDNCPVHLCSIVFIVIFVVVVCFIFVLFCFVFSFIFQSFSYILQLIKVWVEIVLLYTVSIKQKATNLTELIRDCFWQYMRKE